MPQYRCDDQGGPQPPKPWKDDEQKDKKKESEKEFEKEAEKS